MKKVMQKYKYTIILMCLCLTFNGCLRTPYRYSFSLVKPKNETMNFEDKNVHFSFIPSPESIQVAIRNKTDLKTNLVRDKAMFVDHLGKTHSVIYGNNFANEVTLFGNNNEQASPIRIEPGTEISGYFWINIWLNYSVMVPSERRSDKSEIYYFMQPFFPRFSDEGNAEELKDSKFKLILPIEIDGQIKDYTFTFMIDDVIK
ncbi:MAG: hypothetical protein GY777_20265 [Candidatus Brocadiaceae bacterium]|nr:hypothetical protein [Candidatus Brocadiaceae bacterium]